MCVYMLSHFSCIQLFLTLWTVAHQAPLFMGFSRQEYWSGLPCPPAWDLPNPGIELRSPQLQAVSLLSQTPGKRYRCVSCLYQLSSVTQSCPTLCDPMDCSTPGLPTHHQLPCPLSHWCHPTISSSVVPSPPALNLSQHQGLFKWVSPSICGKV